jgi:hypothetical protein
MSRGKSDLIVDNPYVLYHAEDHISTEGTRLVVALSFGYLLVSLFTASTKMGETKINCLMRVITRDVTLIENL